MLKGKCKTSQAGKVERLSDASWCTFSPITHLGVVSRALVLLENRRGFGASSWMRCMQLPGSFKQTCPLWEIRPVKVSPNPVVEQGLSRFRLRRLIAGYSVRVWAQSGAAPAQLSPMTEVLAHVFCPRCHQNHLDHVLTLKPASC